MIVIFYKEHQQTSYDADVNNQIRYELQLFSKERKSLKYCRDRYTFRVLGMLDDYYAVHPFKEAYPDVSRYKLQLEPFCQDLAEEFRAGLAVKKNTVSMLYSIARDFFHHLQQQQVTELATIHQENLYDFLRMEYKDHQSCMNNVTYVPRLICEHFRSASFTGIRAIDIANIKLVDINWREMTVHFVQHKTGFGLSLPLVASAAAAVADYILNARPEADRALISFSLK